MDEHKGEKLKRDTLRMKPVGGERLPSTQAPKGNGEYRTPPVRREASQTRYSELQSRTRDYSDNKYSSERRVYSSKPKMETPYIVILAVVITLIAVLSVVLLVIRSSSPELEADPGIEAPIIQEQDIPEVTPDDITDEEIIDEPEEVIEEEEPEEVIEEEEPEKEPEPTQTPEVSTEPENTPEIPATEPPAPTTPEVTATPEPAPSPEPAPPVTEPATEPPAPVQEQPATGNDSGLADLVR